MDVLAPGECNIVHAVLADILSSSQTSTARMGTSTRNSVVDCELRVHGVDGLRVMDASVFSDQVSGHPCAVIVAMAERAADLIRGANL